MRYLILLLLISCSLFGQRSGTVMTSYNNSSAVSRTTVTENSLPSTQITSPSDGDTLTIDTSFTASVTATDSDGTIDSVVFFINDTRQAVDVSSPYTYNLPTGSVINRELKAIAYDNDLGTGIDSINYYINDTTTPVVVDSDSTFLHFYTGCTPSFNYVGTSGESEFYVATAFCDTIVNIQGTGDAYEWTATHDVDSVEFFLNPSRDDTSSLIMTVNSVEVIEFNISKNSEVTEFDTSFAFLADSGDVIGIKSGTWYFRGDAAVFYNNYVNEAIAGADYVFSIPENEDEDYFVGLLGDSVQNGNPIVLMDDWDKFYSRNDSLFTKFSFDYEAYYNTTARYTCGFYDELDNDTINIIVNITDVTGKWDTDGWADSEVCAKYGLDSTVAQHYIVWNMDAYPNDAGRNTGWNAFNETRFDTITQRTVIHFHAGNHDQIEFGTALQGSAGKRTYLTNFLGKVHLTDSWDMRSSHQWLCVTGRYDTVLGLGHRNYQGFADTANWNFLRGTFGIEIEGRWPRRDSITNEPNQVHAMPIGAGAFDYLKVEFIEIDGPFFSGINMKWNDNLDRSEADTIQFCYIHDVDSEPVYIGSTTESAPQQVFDGLVVRYNLMLRTGDGPQIGRIGGGHIHNNVSQGGLDFLSQFQANQDNTAQYSTNGRRTVWEENLHLTGGQGINMGQSIIESGLSGFGYTIEADTMFFRNNFQGFVRRNHSVYHPDNDTNAATLSVMMHGNFYKGNQQWADTGYGQFENFPSLPPYLYEVRLRQDNDTMWNNTTGMGYIGAWDNTYDTTIAGVWVPNYNNDSKLDSINTQVDTVASPNFVNLYDDCLNYDFGYDFKYWNMIFYHGKVGEKAQAGSYNGDDYRKDSIIYWPKNTVVVYYNSNGETRYYKCLVAHGGGTTYGLSSPVNQVHRPSRDDNNPDTQYWEQLKWLRAPGDTVPFPPDNPELVSGSFYETKGWGIRKEQVFEVYPLTP